MTTALNDTIKNILKCVLSERLRAALRPLKNYLFDNTYRGPWSAKVLEKTSVEQVKWDGKEKTNYNDINFDDIEFFEENALAKVEKSLLGEISGTKHKKSEMTHKERAFLNGIIRKTKPKTIVEIGLSAGGSTCVILNAISDMEDAKLYSFDYNTNWYWEKTLKNARKTGFLLEETVPELMSKWELYTGGVPCKYFDEHLPKDGIDIAFIDTAHENPGEHLNILEILPYMKKNGIVILHDTVYHTLHSANGTTCHVVLNTLKGKHISLNSEETMGLPNIGAIVLDENVDDMLLPLFSNVSLPWYYRISDDDFVEMYKHFSKYYSRYLMKIYVYYCYFYMNDGLHNREYATRVAEKAVNDLEMRKEKAIQ